MVLDGLKVLVVEDELLILELFEFTLKLHRADVKTARNVREAIDVMRSWRPNVIVTDIGLPETDGYSFIQILRKDPETATLPVIALSGYLSTSHVQFETDQNLMRIGKPVDPDYLVRILAEKKKKADQASRQA